MKINIPDQLKQDMPQSFWGKMLSATPVVMTVVVSVSSPVYHATYTVVSMFKIGRAHV